MIIFIKRVFVVALICNCFQISIAFADSAQKEIQLDRIVAIVNEGVVLESELNREIQTLKKQLRKRMDLPPDDVLRTQVLERLVMHKLQLDEAANYGITIDDITLNESIKEIATSNGLDMKGLRQKLSTEGVDFDLYRQDIKKEITVNRLRQNLISRRIRVSAAEVDEYISSQEGEGNKDSNEYLVSHIQLSLQETATHETVQETKKKIDALYDKLKSGSDFARLAVTESSGRNALEGGDLGWHRLTELPKQFAITLKGLTPGDISKPFRTDHGFHILKLRQTKGIKRIVVRQVKARHILMETDKLSSDEQVRTKLLDIRQQLLGGANFSKFAEELSIDPGSAANGGELDWTELKVFTPQFAKVIETLPVNKPSQPFQTQYGWHLVEVLGWRDYDKTIDLERESAFQTLFERKASFEEDLWLRQLRSSAFVEIRQD